MMRELMRILALLGKNLLLTVPCLILWLLIGYGVGSLVAGSHYPAAGRFRTGGGGNVSYATLDRYDALRNSIITFSAWCGLITAQSVFIVRYLGVDRAESHRPGGFPVVQETRA